MNFRDWIQLIGVSLIAAAVMGALMMSIAHRVFY
jgi:hypothetical protein